MSRNLFLVPRFALRRADGSVWIFAVQPEEGSVLGNRSRSLVFEYSTRGLRFLAARPFSAANAQQTEDGRAFFPQDDGTVIVLEHDSWTRENALFPPGMVRSLLVEQGEVSTRFAVSTLDDVFLPFGGTTKHIRLGADAVGLFQLARLSPDTFVGVNGSLWLLGSNGATRMEQPAEHMVAVFVDGETVWAASRKRLYTCPSSDPTSWTVVPGSEGDYSVGGPRQVGPDLYFSDWSELAVVRNFRTTACREILRAAPAPWLSTVGSVVVFGDHIVELLDDAWAAVSLPRLRMFEDHRVLGRETDPVWTRSGL